MLLATDALTEDQRDRAFAVVPDAEQLRTLHAIALNLVRNRAVDLIDLGFGAGNYVREALVAFLDGADLARRAAGQIADSMAVELYATDNQVRGYLPDKDWIIDDEARANLRRHLIEMPLQDAAVRIDGALNHLANAVVRFVWESNCMSEDEARRLGIDRTLPATERWKSERAIAGELRALAERGSPLAARHVLSWALYGCISDGDVGAALELRDRLIHREVPSHESPYATTRRSLFVDGPFSVAFPSAVQVQPERLADVRQSLARALSRLRDLLKAVVEFVPRWATECGFSITIEGITVTIRGSWDPVILQPGNIIYGPDGLPLQIRGGHALRSTVRARASRDPGQFIQRL